MEIPSIKINNTRMTKLLSCFLIGFLTILSLACDKEGVSPRQEIANISWELPAVGTQSRYIHFQGNNYFDFENTEFKYTADTLILEVLQADEKGITLAEYLSAGSVSRRDPENSTLDPESRYEYRLRLTADSIFVTPVNGDYLASRLFPLYRLSGLPLNVPEKPLVSIRGWKTSLPPCACTATGIIPSWTLFGKTYTNLNVVQNDTWMAVDGPGSTLIFSAREGIVRAFSVNPWRNKGEGWDLLP